MLLKLDGLKHDSMYSEEITRKKMLQLIISTDLCLQVTNFRIKKLRGTDNVTVLNSEPTKIIHVLILNFQLIYLDLSSKVSLENGYRNLFILGRNNAVMDYYTSFKYGIAKDIAL